MATPPKPFTPGAGLRFTMKFADNYQAITETHCLAATNPLQDLQTGWTQFGKPLMTQRALLMGTGVVAISARVSVIGSPRVYFVAPANDISNMGVGPQALIATLTPQEQAAEIPSKMTGDADVPNVSVLMNVYDSTYGLHARYYLAGLPGVFVAENPASPPVIRVQSWAQAFNNYVAQLINDKWGWMTRIPASAAGWGSTAVQFVGNDPTTGYFFIQCPALNQTPQINQTIQLQGFQMTSRSYLNPNGTWQIANLTAVGGLQQYNLRGSGNVNSQFVNIIGTARPIGYTFTQYAKCLLGAIASRKRGGSGLAPRGKRKSVVRVPA